MEGAPGSGPVRPMPAAAPLLGRGWALYAALTATWGVLGLLLDQWWLLVGFVCAAFLGGCVFLYRAAARVAWLRPLFIRRTVRFTRVGLFYLLLIGVMALAALNTGLNLLYLVFAMLLAMLLVSGVLSEHALRGLRVAVQPPPPLAAGETAVLAIRLLNRKRLFASWALRVEPAPAPGFRLLSGGFAPRVAPRREAEARVRVQPSRRGLVPIGTIRISTGFPFGFVRHVWWHPTPAVLTVLPRVGRCLRLPGAGGASARTVSRRAEGPGDEEFHTLRDYRPGDNPRRIHWRSSARARRLMVREQHASRRGVALVVLGGTAAAPEGLDDVADVACTVAAGLHHAGWESHAALATGDAGRHLRLSDGRGVDPLRRSLVDWAGGDAQAALRAVPPGVLRGALVVVVAAGEAAGAPAVALAREHGASVELWLPPDVWTRGWVDFGTTEPPWRPSSAAPTAAPSTT